MHYPSLLNVRGPAAKYQLLAYNICWSLASNIPRLTHSIPVKIQGCNISSFTANTGLRMFLYDHQQPYHVWYITYLSEQNLQRGPCIGRMLSVFGQFLMKIDRFQTISGIVHLFISFCVVIPGLTMFGIHDTQKSRFYRGDGLGVTREHNYLVIFAYGLIILVKLTMGKRVIEAKIGARR